MAKDKDFYLVVPEELRRKMVAAAREFRKMPTRSEALLWRALRGRNFEGVKFRRQQPIGPFVLDFYAPACRLVVEVDGPVHDTQQAADHARQELLETLGLCILRLPAALVEENLPAALILIKTAIHQDDLKLPSPLVGEGPGVGE